MGDDHGRERYKQLGLALQELREQQIKSKQAN